MVALPTFRRGQQQPRVTIGDLQKKVRLYGPAIPLTLKEIADRARADPMPLRGPDGGYYAADRHPAILARQLAEFEDAFGEADTAALPKWVVLTGLALLTLVLAGAGFFLLPMFLGLQGGVVQGAGGLAQGVGPWAGIAVGLIMGLGVSVWLYRIQGISAQSNDIAWDTVYAPARITQVIFLDRLGNPVPEDSPGAKRIPVRRMRTHLKRAAFADRQEVFVTASDGEGKKKGRDSAQRRFRTGEIRLETTRDLTQVQRPNDLYDGKALTGRWRGVNSLRWFVALKYPLETGLVALQYQKNEDLRSAARRFFVSTYGWWVLLVCVIGGLVMFFTVLDYQEGGGAAAQEEVPDRTITVTPEQNPGPGRNSSLQDQAQDGQERLETGAGDRSPSRPGVKP